MDELLRVMRLEVAGISGDVGLQERFNELLLRIEAEWNKSQGQTDSPWVDADRGEHED